MRPAKIQMSLASAQTDQSLRCPHEDTLNPKLPIERTTKTLIRLGGCHFAIVSVLSCAGSNFDAVLGVCVPVLFGVLAGCGI